MNENVLNILKVWYKDEVVNCLFRNSPVFNKIVKERVEGKSQNFPALAGFAGGVGASYDKAVGSAAQMGTVAQWQVTPGQVFGAVQFDSKEVLASRTNRGAFAKIADTKLFTTFDMVKKVLAACLYGRGYGELCASGYTTAITAGTPFDIALPECALMCTLPGMKLDLKSSITASVVNAKLTVTDVGDNYITVISDTSVASPAATDIICIADSTSADGKPLLPVGLAGWLPNVAGRTGANWSTFINLPFFGVTRKANQAALCGAYVDDTNNNVSMTSTLTKVIRKIRRQGATTAFIIVNDEDRQQLNDELAATSRYITETKTSASKGAKIGVGEISAVFSSSEVPEIIDDPFCPKGRAYIIGEGDLKFWGYSNVDKALNTGVAGNEPGVQEFSDEGDVAAKPYALLIDDILSLQPGVPGQNGPSTVIGITVYGSYVVTNAAHCGVANFYGNTDFQRLATA